MQAAFASRLYGWYNHKLRGNLPVTSFPLYLPFTEFLPLGRASCIICGVQYKMKICVPCSNSIKKLKMAMAGYIRPSIKLCMTIQIACHEATPASKGPF